MFDLKEFRKNAGLTQAAMGEILGVKKPFVSEIENGKKSMPPHWIQIINEHFNLNLSEVKPVGKPNTQQTTGYATNIDIYQTINALQIKIVELENRIEELEKAQVK